MGDNLLAEGARNQRALLYTMLLTIAYLGVEIGVGLLSNSLALIADAVHMFTDAAALGMALFAARLAHKPATAEKTYGYYRAEILAALLNGILITLGSVFILYEAYRRFQMPSHVVGLPMLIVAAIGLVVNVLGIWILRRGGEDGSLNMKGALYEVVKDALGSLGVLVAGAVILLTGWSYIDPIVSVGIALLILPRTWQLLSQAVDILLEAAPTRIDVQAMVDAIRGIENVQAVHDVHVWTITSGFVVMSGHVVVAGNADRKRAQAILEEVKSRLHQDWEIDHVTIQIEFENLESSEASIARQVGEEKPERSPG